MKTSDRGPAVEMEITRSASGKRRSVEAELALDAPVEAVWKALTEAQELERWFPPTARVEAGVGGTIELAWDEQVKTRMAIEIWEPGRHLRTLWVARRVTEAGEEEAVPAVVDFRLEAEGGATRLRLVHSGFSADEDWDDLFDGFRRGWAYELRSLKHYLERHRGYRRGLARVQHAIEMGEREAWRRLFADDGFFRGGEVESLGEGDAYRLRTSTGETLSGEVRLVLPFTDFAASVETMEGSLLRVKIGPMGDPDRPLVQLWLACWRLAERQVRALEASWQRALEAVFIARREC